VVVTDTNFNLVRMFNHTGFSEFGGAFNDLRIWSMAIDPQMNVLFVGSYTQDTLVFGADTVYSDGYQEGFLTKCDSMGQPLLIKSFGSRLMNYNYEDRAQSVCTDPNGNIYVGVSFDGGYFQINADTVHNGVSVGLNSYAHAAVFSLTPTGQTRWLKSFGTPTQDEGVFGISADAAGNVTVCGSTSASNQDFVFGSITYHYKPSQLGYQSYAGRFDSNGNAVWFFPMETYYATGPDISAYDVDVDDNGNSYVAGHFDAHAVFNNDTVTTLNYTSSYLLKINASGQKQFVKIGNIDTFYPYPLAVKHFGDKVFLTGQSYTNRLTFEQYGLCCSMDGFFAMYDTTGQILWLKGISSAGSSDGVAFNVAFTSAGTGVACGFLRNGAITLAGTTVNAGAGDYYLVRFAEVASNGLTMSLLNNGSDTINCGQTVPLQMIASPTTNTRYFWYADNDTVPGPFYNATHTGSPKFTTTYYASAYNGACVVEDSITISVIPVTVNAGNDTSVCDGSLLQLQGNTIPNATYFWSPITGLSNDTIHDPLLQVTGNTQLLYQLNSGGCVNTDTLQVFVFPDPVASFTYTANNLSLSLTGAMQFAGAFLWNFGDGNTDPTNLNPVHQYATSGTYNVCLYAYNDCGGDTLCQVVNITNVGLNEVTANGISVREDESNFYIVNTTGKNVNLSVRDLSGRLVYTTEMDSQMQISKSGLVSGLYLLSVGADKILTRKFSAIR
jgi:PKD repeat protein